MNTLSLFRACLLPALLMTSAASAAISWESMLVKADVPLGKESVEIALPFTNEGDSRVTIESVSTSCGCTVATLEKKVYEPGERGVIKVVYDATGQVSMQERYVTVFSSDTPSEPHVLKLEITAPELFTITPRLVYWRVGAATDEKQIAIKLNPKLTQPTLTLTQDGGDKVVAELRRQGEGPDYLLVVKPVSTEAAFRSTFRLLVEAEEMTPRPVSVYAQVR